MRPARKKQRQNSKEEKKFTSMPLLAALENLLAQFNSELSREACESDVALPLGCSLGEAATLIAQSLPATGRAASKFVCQSKISAGSRSPVSLSLSSSFSSYSSTAATKGRDILLSLPTAVFSHVLSYLSLFEYFSVLVPVSSFYMRFSYRRSVLPSSELIVNEDEDSKIVRYGSFDGPAIPMIALRRLGCLGLTSITIRSCGPLSLNLLANPRTQHLQLENTNLGNDLLAPLARMTSLETFELDDAAGDDIDSLRHLRGLPLTSLNIGSYDVCQEPSALTLDTLDGMPLRKLRLDCFVINGLETLLPLGLPLEELSFNCELPRLDHLRHYPLKRLSLSHSSGDCFVALPELPFLEELDLSGSWVKDEGLSTLGKLVSLKKLSLKECESITGKCLVALSGLPLEKLDLSGLGLTKHTESNLGVGITDDDLSALNELPLKILSVAECKITGVGLASISGLPLEDLDLAHTDVTDACLSALHGMSLRKLSLRCCKQLKGKGLVALSVLPLEDLDLAHTDVTDASLSALHGMSLRKLSLRRCKKLKGKGLVALSDLPLEDLDLSYTKVTDESLLPLSAFPLKNLGLSGCKKITRAGVACLSHIPKVKSAYA
eukprot:gb/GEZN01002522.1/.p1 GENE.gb/GEZN01002522.1/~~gb/GEZN01002522.1/.p1  ORF type:complete len:608 (-),score=55.49 gb/GEZN01002522.1/:525-2348(-)